MSNERPSHRDVVDSTAATEESMRPQPVPVNIYEAPEALVVLAPLPAVMPDDVTVELRPGTLRFWARLRSAGPRDYLVNEWDYGGYEREIELPDGYGSGVEATLANGQLAVRVLRGDTTHGEHHTQQPRLSRPLPDVVRPRPAGGGGPRRRAGCRRRRARGRGRWRGPWRPAGAIPARPLT